MSEEERELFKEQVYVYLKENLQVNVSVDSMYHNVVQIDVSLILEGETISSHSDSVSISTGD